MASLTPKGSERCEMEQPKPVVSSVNDRLVDAVVPDDLLATSCALRVVPRTTQEGRDYPVESTINYLCKCR